MGTTVLRALLDLVIEAGRNVSDSENRSPASSVAAGGVRDAPASAPGDDREGTYTKTKGVLEVQVPHQCPLAGIQPPARLRRGGVLLVQE
jgi:hypothetical protein